MWPALIAASISEISVTWLSTALSSLSLKNSKVRLWRRA